MALYCGIDLHSTSSHVCVIDEEDRDALGLGAIASGHSEGGVDATGRVTEEVAPGCVRPRVDEIADGLEPDTVQDLQLNISSPDEENRDPRSDRAALQALCGPTKTSTKGNSSRKSIRRL